MQIAALAYDQLTPAARAKTDALIKLNPQYDSWVAGVEAGKAAQYAFIRASTWCDDIKRPELGHTADGDEPTRPEAGRNIGYYDNLMHRSGDILPWNSLSRLWCDTRIIHSRESELLLSAVTPMLTNHTS